MLFLNHMISVLRHFKMNNEKMFKGVYNITNENDYLHYTCTCTGIYTEVYPYKVNIEFDNKIYLYSYHNQVLQCKTKRQIPYKVNNKCLSFVLISYDI